MWVTLYGYQFGHFNRIPKRLLIGNIKQIKAVVYYDWDFHRRAMKTDHKHFVYDYIPLWIELIVRTFWSGAKTKEIF